MSRNFAHRGSKYISTDVKSFIKNREGRAGQLVEFTWNHPDTHWFSFTQCREWHSTVLVHPFIANNWHVEWSTLLIPLIWFIAMEVVVGHCWTIHLPFVTAQLIVSDYITQSNKYLQVWIVIGCNLKKIPMHSGNKTVLKNISLLTRYDKSNKVSDSQGYQMLVSRPSGRNNALTCARLWAWIPVMARRSWADSPVNHCLTPPRCKRGTWQ